MIKFLFKIFESDRSSKWRTIREKFLKKNPKCISCNTNNNLQVHHIVPVSVDPSKELYENNLCTLCETCHFVFGHLHNWKNYNPEVIRDCQEHYQRVKQFTVKRIKQPMSFWRKVMTKFFASTTLVLAVVCTYMGHILINESNRFFLMRDIYSAENRVLKDELYTERSKPTYEQGFHDAVVRAGIPAGSGAYRDGFDAAKKLYGDGSWATGYHTAIEQFGWKEEITNLNKEKDRVSMK